MELFRRPVSQRRFKVVGRGSGSIGADVSYDGEHRPDPNPSKSWISVGPLESPDGKYQFDLRMTLAEARGLAENLHRTLYQILGWEDE